MSERLSVNNGEDQAAIPLPVSQPDWAIMTAVSEDEDEVEDENEEEDRDRGSDSDTDTDSDCDSFRSCGVGHCFKRRLLIFCWVKLANTNSQISLFLSVHNFYQ